MPITNIRGQQILNNTVQYVDIQQVAALRLVGNPTVSAATMSEISLGTGLSFSGSSLVLSANLQSLSGLSYSSASFVKMTAAGTFALDTNTYITGSGSTNFLPKWTSSTSLGNSLIDDDGIGVAVALAAGGYFSIRYLSAIKLALTGGTTFGSIDIPVGLDFLIRPDSIEKFKISSTGLLKLANYGSGSVTGTATYRLAVDSAGNVIEVSDGGGTVTSVSGTGTVSGLTLTGTVTSSGSLTLGGTLTLTSGQVTTALGYTPYNATNPNGYISSYTETDTLASVTGRGATTSTAVTFNGTANFNANVTLGNNADLVFVDLAGTFPTTGKGFDWTLNNDGARIYAIQPSSDSIDLVFQLRDNATTNDRFVFWVDDYQGPAFDKYPLIMRGGTEVDLVSSALYTNGTLRLSNAGVLQNVSGNISMFTNNVGYITGYTETDTLASVTGRGSTTTIAIGAPNFYDATGSYNVNLGSGGSEGRGLVAGYSGGSYGGIGYNVRHTTTGGSWIAPGTDTSSYILFQAGGFTFYGAASGTAGRTLAYTTLGTFSSAGLFNAVNITVNGNQVWHAGNLTNLNQLTNGPGYITGESDTLATVTARGASTSTAVTLSSTANSYSGHHYFIPHDANGNHYPHYNIGANNNGSKLNLRMYGGSGGTVRLFYLNGNDASISWDGNTIWHAGNDGSGSGLDADLLDGNHASAFALINGNTGQSFGVFELSYAQTAFNPSTAPRTGLNAMSVKMWDNYFYGTGLGSDYGTVMDYYGRSGHVNTQVYFDASGESWYRTAAYAAGFGSWHKYWTTQNFNPGAYLPLAGGTMTGNINWGQTDRGLTWGMNTDGAYIKFFNTGDGDTDSRLEYNTSDNGDEYHRFLIAGNERFTIKNDAARFNNNVVLHAGNYNSYAPTLTGGNASGTWGINITGSARLLDVDNGVVYGRSGLQFGQSYNTAGNDPSIHQTPTADSWWHVLRMNHGNNAGYYADLAVSMTSNLGLSRRVISNGVQLSNWVTILDGLNYNSYSPTLTGTGASGTWSISITGNADTVDGLHASAFVRTYGTTNDNIDSDYGECFITFDPIPSGTPPIQSPNLRTINVGANFSRRTQLAFDYATDRAFFRRKTDSAWYSWVELYHTGNLTNLNQLTNGPGYITGESDTLSSVTGRGASTPSNMTIANANPVFILKDTNNSGTGVGQIGYISFQDSGNAERAWIGYGSETNTAIYITNNKGDVLLNPSTGAAYVGGNIIWHAGNDGSGSGLDADLLDGYHAGSFFRDLGFAGGYPSLDANTMEETRSGFTYSNGAPLTGCIAYFGAAGYGIQLNGNYAGDEFSMRSRNGDNATFRPWKRLLTDYNYSSYALPLSGGSMTGKIITPSTGADSYGGALEIRERAYALASQSVWSYSPAITFHWGNRAVVRFGMRSDGLMAVDENPIVIQNGGTWNISISGKAETVTINYNNDSNSTYQLLWGSGNSVYGTGNVYVNPSTDAIYTGGYRGSTNVGGTGEASWHPAGIYSGGTQWLYGTTYRNSAATYGQGNLYFDGNYGYGMVGLYSDTRYQAVFAMGDSYKLPADGTTTGSLYGLAWSHPNKGGVAANLNTHGLLVMENGTFLAAISGSIRARDDIRAPIFYDSGNSGYSLNGDTNSAWRISTPSGVLDIGPMNSSYCHFQTDRGTFYFSTRVEVNGELWRYNGSRFVENTGTWDINVTGYSQRVLSTSISNVNTGRTAGTLEYYDLLDATGAPGSGWNSYISVRHGNAGNQYGFQFANPFGSDTLYWRGWDGSNPLSWRSIWHSGNLSSSFYIGTTFISLGRASAGQTLTGVSIDGNAATVSDGMYLSPTQTVTGIKYFRSNRTAGVYLKDSNSAQLQAYSDDSSAAFMSFHRGGYYAVNMGLDPDNVFRIGGWSAGANVLQLDMSGNLYSGASMYPGGHVYFANESSPYTNTIRFGDNTGWILRMQTSVSGTYTTRFSFSDGGTFTAVGDVVAYSDARVKTNVATITDPLDKVTRMRGVTYNRTDSTDTSEKVGVIAQEIQQVLPQVVNEDKDGMLGVSYGNLAGVFIEAIKEQQKQIEDLKKQIAYLVENR